MRENPVVGEVLPGLWGNERRVHRGIWYMGAKSRILPGFLGAAIEEELPNGGALLDLMCGSGVVSAYAADGRRVLANDVQAYAAVITASLIEHQEAGKKSFIRRIDFERDLGDLYRSHLDALERRYRPALEIEAELLSEAERALPGPGWADRYRRFLTRPDSNYPAAPRPGSPYYGARGLLSERAIEARRRDPGLRPPCMVTAYYANVYFGLRQSLEIDALRAAIEDARTAGRIGERRRTHYLAALLHAASVATSGTSHFAQPRHVRKESELLAMARRRSLGILPLFEEYSREILATVGGTRFAGGNRVFNLDWPELFRAPHREALRDVGLVYLDPPYTADNYSRFYHVLEELVRYEYPPLARDRSGAIVRGRYPALERRHRSAFASSAGVEDAFRGVIRAAASLGASLAISYAWPSGLLFRKRGRRPEPREKLLALCREVYDLVELRTLPLLHSGQGDSCVQVEELLVLCR